MDPGPHNIPCWQHACALDSSRSQKVNLDCFFVFATFLRIICANHWVNNHLCSGPIWFIAEEIMLKGNISCSKNLSTSNTCRVYLSFFYNTYCLSVLIPAMFVCPTSWWCCPGVHWRSCCRHTADSTPPCCSHSCSLPSGGCVSRTSSCPRWSTRDDSVRFSLVPISVNLHQYLW